MSRRFKSRHGKVVADPKASPAKPVDLTDENSYTDAMQPDCRKPVPRGRVYTRAESAIDQEEEGEPATKTPPS